MKKILLITIIILSIYACSGLKVINEKEFTQKYWTTISKKYPQVKFEIDGPLVLKAYYEENGDLTLFLENAYREYKTDINHLDEVIKKYSDASTNLFKNQKQIDINRIIPIIKPADFFEQFKSPDSSNKENEKPDLIWEEYNKDLIIIYAEDRDNNINYFNKEKFEQLKIDKDSLLNFSLNNLEKLIPKIETVVLDNNSYGLMAGENYEASLILIQSLWTKDNFNVKGDILISIPNRDLVFITGTKDFDAIKRIKKSTDEYYENENHPISKEFYIWNGAKFVKYQL